MTSPRRSVRAVLFDRQGRVALIERHRPGRSPYFVLPGGGIEPGESDCAALARELLEELGATVLIEALLRFDDPDTAIYRCQLVALDSSLRTGPEFTDPVNGTYNVRWYSPIELQAAPFPVYPSGSKELLVRSTW